ncbi:hypothetical protein [Hydrogenophaga sp.]|uniref:hypothetical protein n=1 Tax=Hydrogenophaga sp. TaxID=1904254 RepID=UPI003F7306D9
MMMIFIIPQSFLWLKVPCLSVVLVWMLVEGTRDRWKIRSHAFLPYYLIFGFLSVAWCIVGLARGNPEIAIVEALRVYVVYMAIFCALTLYVSNLEYQAHADRIVIAGAFGIGVVALYALLDHIFRLGWLPQSIKDDMYLQVGLHPGYVQMNNVNIGMLTFIVPYLLSRVLLGERNERQAWLLLGLAVAVVSAVLASRRVVLVLLVLTPLLAFALTVLAGHARQHHLRRFVQFYSFPLLVAGFGGLMVVYGGFDFFDGFAGRVAAAFNTDADAPRPQQHVALMAAFADSYFWGSGFGGLTSVVRSDERPWTFELTYSRLLFNAGLLGMGILLLFFCTYLYLTLRKIRRSAHTSIQVSLLTGFLTVLIAAASNPYLSSFDFLFALSIIPLILNSRDQPRPARAPGEGVLQ